MNQLEPINKLIEKVKLGNNETAESGISMSPGMMSDMSKESIIKFHYGLENCSQDTILIQLKRRCPR